MLKHCNQIANSILYDLVLPALCRQGKKFKPDDHSEVVPLLPIPNRTVKRLSANDSAGSRVKVGHRQANISRYARLPPGVFFSKEPPGHRLAAEVFLFLDLDAIDAFCWTQFAVFSGLGRGSLRFAVLQHL